MLAQIEAQLPAFSRAERSVARWVLAHPRQAARATLAEISGACGTSEPTVIRFCRRLGLSGFRELTLGLTEALSQPASLVHRAVSADVWYEKLELLTLNAEFTPDLLFASMTGASDFCLGASTALRRSTLEEIGGMASLAEYLVEDYEMGRRIGARGMKAAAVAHLGVVTGDQRLLRLLRGRLQGKGQAGTAEQGH